MFLTEKTKALEKELSMSKRNKVKSRKATKKSSGFRDKSSKNHMTTREMASHVSDHPMDYDERTRRQASMSKMLMSR